MEIPIINDDFKERMWYLLKIEELIRSQPNQVAAFELKVYNGTVTDMVVKTVTRYSKPKQN